MRWRYAAAGICSGSLEFAGGIGFTPPFFGWCDDYVCCQSGGPCLLAAVIGLTVTEAQDVAELSDVFP